MWKDYEHVIVGVALEFAFGSEAFRISTFADSLEPVVKQTEVGWTVEALASMLWR